MRSKDKYDTPIKYWKEAGLTRPSVARISKTMNLTKDRFTNKKGVLHKDDISIIQQKFVEFIQSK